MSSSPGVTLLLSLVFLAGAGLFWFRIVPEEWLPKPLFVPETALFGAILFGLSLYQYWKQDSNKP